MKTLETKNAPAAIGPYSQAKMVNNFVFASGQIPVDPATGEVAGDTIETQAEQDGVERGTGRLRLPLYQLNRNRYFYSGTDHYVHVFGIYDLESDEGTCRC